MERGATAPRSGGERYFSTANHTSGNIAVGASFSVPAGIYATVERLSGGTYRITERSGMKYLFESVNGTATNTGQRARLLSITDRNGNALTLSYAAIGGCPGTYVCKVSDGLNRALTFTYTSGRLTQVADWTGRTWQYTVDAAGDLVSFKNPLAVAGAQPPVTYQYYTAADNLAHALKQYQLPRGNGMRFEYYANGRVFRHTPFDTAGALLSDHATTFAWSEFRRESKQIDAQGYERVFLFDKYGNPIAITDEAGAQTSYTYDQTAGRTHLRLSKTDAQGMTTGYAYDGAGNLTDVTLPSGRTVQYRDHTAFGQPQRVKDAANNWTLLKYDTQGNLTDTLSLRAGITPSAGVKPANTDLLAWTQSRVDGVGNVTGTRRLRDWVSASLGNYSSGVGPALEATLDASLLNVASLTRRGDLDGSPGTLEVETTSDFQYDALGRQTRGPDANWYPADSSWDALDRPLQAPDGRGHTWAQGYDANGNLLTRALVVNGALIDGGYLSWDSLDRLERSVDYAGNATATEYNPLGHVTAVTGPDGYTLGFDRDPLGRITGAYDAEGHRVTFTRDAEGRVRSSTDPNGESVTFTWDAGGRLIEQRLTSGLRTTQAWFEDGGLKERKNLYNSTTLSSHSYTLDVFGRRATQSENVGGTTKSWTYGYDRLDRLTSASDGTAETYSYDVWGNRRTKTRSGATTAYLYDAAHRLNEVRSGSDVGALVGAAIHDADGHLTKLCEGPTVTKTASDCSASGTGATTLNLAWNALEHLLTATRTGVGAISESYAYDDQGRRIRKTSGASTTHFLYDGDAIHAEWSGSGISGMPAAVYAQGAGVDAPLLRLTGATNGPGATQAAFLQDGLGSVVGTVSSAGALTASQRFDAWGNRTAGTGTVPQYGYTGREPDATGLVFYRARYYHPGIGRFVSHDPMGMADAVSPYAYVANGPTLFVDPFGLKARNPEVLQALLSGGSYVDWSNAVQIACGPGCVALGQLAGKPVAPPAATNTPGYQGLQGRSAEDQLLETPSDSGPGVLERLGGYVDAATQGLDNLVSSAGKAWLDLRDNIGSLILSEKRGPKTDPEAPHNARIRAEGDRLAGEGNRIIAGGGRRPEQLIPTPGGNKSGRRPDIVYETPDGAVRGVNVGRTKANGSPVTREQKALDDLNGPGGLPTDFVPYD